MTTTGALEGFAGTVLRPGDDDYEEARRIWNAAVDKHPAFVARCTSAADVAAAVRFGVAHDLPIAVRGGGHSIPGHSTCEGGLVVDLSTMSTVEVDAAARTAVVGGGALLGQLDAATTAHGLATPAGEISHTGVAGLALGGGIGWLSRAHGLTCDNLLAAEVVTADGTVHAVDGTSDPEWLWGLRGGGGNFGIVTRFTFRLHDLPPLRVATAVHHDVLAGLQQYARLAPTLPRQAGAVAALVTAPPAPPFPPHLHGRPVAVVTVAAWGDDAERAVAPVRDGGAPLVHEDVLPYTVLQSMVDETAPHGLAYHAKSELLGALDDEALQHLAAGARSMTSPRAQVLLRLMGGAVSDVPPAATAFAHRSAQHLLTVAGVWEPGTPAEPHRDWCRRVWGSVRPWSAGTYVNQLDGDETGRLVEAYPQPTLARLRALKRRIDPENVFRLNQNVAP